MLLFEGVNDIGHSFDPNGPYDHVSAEELIAAEHLLITRAHANGIRVIGATVGPYLGAKYASPRGEAARGTLNRWIRTSGEFDGIADFDKALSDTTRPGHLAALYDSGDHLHPNDAGMKAIADSIDLALIP